MAFLAALPAIGKMAAPYLLSLLASRIGAGAKYGHAKQMRNKLMGILSPEHLSELTNQLFGQFQASPMYSGLRNRAMTGAASLGNNMNASFYRRGLGTSGIAGVATPLAQSSFQNSFNEIDSNLFTQALSQARQGVGEEYKTAAGYDAPEIGAGTWGAFAESSLPNIYKLMERYWSSTPGQKTTPGMPPMGRPPGGTPPTFPGARPYPQPYPIRPRNMRPY